jgi:hypothetical protein
VLYIVIGSIRESIRERQSKKFKKASPQLEMESSSKGH